MSDNIARKLTDAAVRNAKQNEKPYKMTDGGGLYLLVTTTGARLWRYKFRLHGSEKLHAIGAYPDVSLSAAREAHREARTSVAIGTNPVHARQDERTAAARDAMIIKKGAFETIATAWMIETAPLLAWRSVAQREREIKKYLFAEFGMKPITKVTRVDISTLLKRVEKHAPEVARNLRNYLGALFEYCIDCGMVEANPVPPPRVLKKRSQTPHAAMSVANLPILSAKLDAYGGNADTVAAFRLVVLTACRKNEIVCGRWSEIDLDAAEWIIPADRMKARIEQYVPLSAQAVAILRQLRRMTNGDIIFPNRDNPERSMADRTLNALLERIGFAGETMHGFRSVFSSHFNELKADKDVIERCLAHAPKDKIRAVYNRYQYKEERRVMLQDWADWLDNLNVVYLQQASMAA